MRRRKPEQPQLLQLLSIISKENLEVKKNYYSAVETFLNIIRYKMLNPMKSGNTDSQTLYLII